MGSSTLPVATLPTEEQIKELVDAFYSRVRNDDLLGPVFAAAIGNRWDEHLPKMYDFWSSVVLATRRYQGKPMLAHLPLPGIGREHFERWLAHWRQTSSELLGEPHSSVFINKAELMAERLLFAINTHRGSQTVNVS